MSVRQDEPRVEAVAQRAQDRVIRPERFGRLGLGEPAIGIPKGDIELLRAGVEHGLRQRPRDEW